MRYRVSHHAIKARINLYSFPKPGGSGLWHAREPDERTNLDRPTAERVIQSLLNDPDASRIDIMIVD